MSDDHFDPDSLADYLDSLFDGDELPSGADDPLVDAALRLSNAPKPELDPARFEAIRSQLLKANQANMAASGGATTSTLPAPAIIAGVTLVIVSIVIGIFVITTQDSANGPTVEITAEVTEDITEEASATPALTETVTATETAIPTATETQPDATDAVIVEESATPEPTATTTRTATVTSSATSTGTLTATPEPSETPLPIHLVIEGEVEDIIGNVIIIYDFEIELDPDDPLLTVLLPGDAIRVDGTMEVVDDPESDAPSVIRITPVTVEPITDDIQIDETTGATWRDNGTCSNPPPPWAPATGWRARCEGGTAPGNSGNAPGQGGNNPGQGGSGNNPPGQGGTNPGNGGNPNNCPGNSCNAPGQGGSNPGNSGNPPGQNDDDDD